MSNTNGTPYVLLSSLALALVSTACGDGDSLSEAAPAASTPAPQTWVATEEFKFSLVTQLDSYSASDGIYFIGVGTMTRLTKQDGEDHYRRHPVIDNLDLNARSAVNEQLILVPKDGRIVCYPAQDPTRGYFSFNIKDYDPDFEQFQPASGPTTPSVLLNSENQAIFTYRTSTPERTIGIMLVQFSIDEGYLESEIKVESTTIIPQSPEILWLRPSLFGDEFLMTPANAPFRPFWIRKNGDIETTNNLRAVSNLLSVDDLWIASLNGVLHTSEDGITWSEAGSLGYEVDRLRFYVHEGTTYASFRSQLFRFRIIDDGALLRVDELDNDGLVGHEITSVAFFDDRVFISTLSGVFQRPFLDFLTLRSRENSER